VSLLAAADAAVKDNAGSRVVGIFPELTDGHAVAEVTLLQGTTAKKVTDRWKEYFPSGVAMGDSAKGHLD
jgi:hypothetical protein